MYYLIHLTTSSNDTTTNAPSCKNPFALFSQNKESYFSSQQFRIVYHTSVLNIHQTQIIHELLPITVVPAIVVQTIQVGLMGLIQQLITQQLLVQYAFMSPVRHAIRRITSA